MRIGFGLSLASLPSVPAVSPVLFTLDFTSAALGAMANATFVSTFGLSFARASAATVQTSASTVDSTPTTDQPRFCATGATGIRGLLIEESRSNLIQNNRDESAAGWNAGTSTVTTAYAAGPDGTTGTGSRTQGAGGGSDFGKYQTRSTVSLGTSQVLSAWVRGALGATHHTIRSSGTPTDTFDTIAVAGTTWQRHVFPFTSASPGSDNLFSDSSLSSGLTEDVVTDLMQIESGKFATSAIVTTGATGTRAGEHPSDASASRWSDANRISVEFVFCPLGTPAQYTANAYFWYIDANNNAWMDTSQKVNVKIGGTTVTSASAISWTAGQVVDLWIEAGGGAATKVEYRTSSDGGSTWGSVTTLINSALAGNLAPSAIDVFCSSTTNQMSAILKSITAYKSGHAPAWVV